MNGYKIVLLKAIFMLYRLPESERVCSGICIDAETDGGLVQVRGLLFRRGGKEVGRLVDVGLAVGCGGRYR